MVSQRPRRPPPAAGGTRARILAAAAQEFADRGFDGAKVDRLARRARVNKAMLYYHFGSKAALYQAILSDVFRTIAAQVTAAAAEGGTPNIQLRRFIRVIARVTSGEPHFPAIWLRELAEGGRHLTGPIVTEIGRVLETLGAILEDGRRHRQFRPVHPLIIQMGIVAPLLLFSASEPMRRRLATEVPIPIGAVSRDDMVEYVETATLMTLAVDAGRQPSRRSRK